MAPSKQEWYAWTSLASATALLIWFVTAVTHLSVGASLESLLFKVIVIAFAMELVVSVSQSAGPGRVVKDERDRLIEGLGFRHGYYVFMVAVSFAIGHLAVSEFFGFVSDGRLTLPLSDRMLHWLVVTVLVAGIVNAATRVVLYRRGV